MDIFYIHSYIHVHTNNKLDRFAVQISTAIRNRKIDRFTESVTNLGNGYVRGEKRLEFDIKEKSFLQANFPHMTAVAAG